jgi:hypothetical protein
MTAPRGNPKAISAAQACVLCQAWHSTPFVRQTPEGAIQVRDAHHAMVLGYFCAKAAPPNATICQSHAEQIDAMRALVEHAIQTAAAGGVS